MSMLNHITKSVIIVPGFMGSVRDGFSVLSRRITSTRNASLVLRGSKFNHSQARISCGCGVVDGVGPCRPCYFLEDDCFASSRMSLTVLVRISSTEAGVI